MRDRRHIVISGPSGSGKSSIIKLLLNSNPLFTHSVSHTTRPIRFDEIDGTDYHFVNKQKFRRMIFKTEFLEYAIYNNHYYGTALSQFDNMTKIMILDLERQGVRKLLETGYNFRYIFIYCSKENQMTRLIDRNKSEIISLDALSDISHRIGEYDKDIDVMERAQYNFVVENDNIDQCIREIEEFLYENEEVKKSVDDIVYPFEDSSDNNN